MDVDYDKEVSSAVLGAAGWRLNDFPNTNPFECHAIYVRDYRNGNTQLFCIRQQEFDTAVLPAYASPQHYVSQLTSMLLKPEACTMTAPEAGVLTATLIGYLKSTETFRRWRRVAQADERMHAILNIYPASKNESSLRPFIARAKGTLLTPDDVKSASMIAMEMDKVNRPEWFKAKKKLGGRR